MRQINAELQEIAGTLREKYGTELKQIIFFGSRVRGDATAESDYDCLLVFKNVTSLLKKDLDKLVADWLLEKGIVFSWVALSEMDLERFRYEPFLQNARREGVCV